MTEEKTIKKDEIKKEVSKDENPLTGEQPDSGEKTDAIAEEKNKKPIFKKNEKKFTKKKRFLKRTERPRSEYDQKIINIRRVTRVVAGGRRFSFSVALISGNKKGSVGVGIGKASDTALAIEKATRSAKKAMIKVKLNKNMSIAYDVSAKYNASVVSILPSPKKGLTAGSSLRDVLELAGIKDITAKVLSRSKNKLNNARATIKALEQLN